MLYTVEILVVLNGVIQQMRSFFSAYRITDRNLCKFFEMDFFCRARSDFSPFQPKIHGINVHGYGHYCRDKYVNVILLLHTNDIRAKRTIMMDSAEISCNVHRNSYSFEI